MISCLLLIICTIQIIPTSIFSQQKLFQVTLPNYLPVRMRLLYQEKLPEFFLEIKIRLEKLVLFNNTDLLTVSGVIENSPSNTHLKVDYLVSFLLLEKEGNDFG